MKVENLKHPFILWVIVVFFGDFWDYFLAKFFFKQGICDRIFFYQNIFCKKRRKFTTKNMRKKFFYSNRKQVAIKKNS
jgi:hypothetical protein